MLSTARKPIGKWGWPVLAAAIVVCVVVLSFGVSWIDPPSSGARTSAIGPKVLMGHVYQTDGITPAAGAQVTAAILSGFTIRATQSTTTNSTGFYTVTFGPSDWDIGNLIEVGALLGSVGGLGSAVADSSGVQTVDVTLSTTIPEFSAPFLPVIAAAVAGFALVIRRKIPSA